MDMGFTKDDLTYFGFKLNILLDKFKYTLKELKEVGFTIIEIYTSAFTIDQLNDEIFITKELLKAGFTLKEVMDGLLLFQ